MTVFQRWLLFADTIYDATKNNTLRDATDFGEEVGFFQSLLYLNREETICLAVAEKLWQGAPSETITENQVTTHFSGSTPEAPVSTILRSLTEQHLLNVITRSGEIRYDLGIGYYFELRHTLCRINFHKH